MLSCKSDTWNSSFSVFQSDSDTSNDTLCEFSHLVSNNGGAQVEENVLKRQPEGHTDTKDFNKAFDERELIGHLCNCHNTDFGWCFVHQKASNIESNTRQTEFGFILYLDLDSMPDDLQRSFPPRNF